MFALKFCFLSIHWRGYKLLFPFLSRLFLLIMMNRLPGSPSHGNRNDVAKQPVDSAVAHGEEKQVSTIYL